MGNLRVILDFMNHFIVNVGTNETQTDRPTSYRSTDRRHTEVEASYDHKFPMQLCQRLINRPSK